MPVVMLLEDRRLLSTFTVTGTADSAPAGSPGTGTLRWAVDQADSAASPSTIDFDLGTSPATITLAQGPLVLSNTSDSIAIDGPGASLLSISGNNAGKVFLIEGGVTATLSGLTIADGSSNNGGGVQNAGDSTLLACTISGNSGSTFSYGAGIYNSGTIALDACTISGNSGPTFSYGTGMYNKGEATLSGCTISGNSDTRGGGIDNSSAGTLSLSDCTIFGNSGDSLGGGLLNAGEATLAACTISGNYSSDGGGLFNLAGTATLTDTIVANNTGNIGSQTDITNNHGTVSGQNDLIGVGGSGGLVDGIDGNIVLTSLSGLGLIAPGEYGGPTPTMALSPGSVAIGNGIAGTGIPAVDQRGFPRGSSVNIGSYQLQPSPLAVNTTADGIDSPPGDLNLRQAVNLADALNTSNTITFDPGAFATAQTITLTSGQLVINNTGGTIAIDAPSVGVAISGDAGSRVFAVYGGTAALSGLTITGGDADRGGGLLDSDGALSMTGCTVAGNSAEYGGGLYDQKGESFSLTDCTISGNSAEKHGGGVENFAAAPLVMIGCTIRGNFANEGGGLYGRSAITLTDCTISGNSAAYYGGGVYSGPTATLDNCNFSGNSAVYGGGLSNHGTATLDDCTLIGNFAVGSGGGLFDYGTATLDNCTFDGDSARFNGGGLFNEGPVTLSDCTISGNSAPNGGGLFTYGATATLTGTIVAGNDDGDIGLGNGGGLTMGPGSWVEGVSPSIVTGTYDLIGVGGSGGLVNGSDGNIVLTSLTGIGLAPLGNYGGSTETVALLPGSPAIGAGTAVAGITADQRGVARPAVGIDIGAFQGQGFILTPVVGSTPQAVIVGAPFANPLAVTVTANDPVEPVAGGVVTFAAPTGGASASLSSTAATIGPNGVASVIAVADDTAGLQIVTASAVGAASPVSFHLINVPATITTVVVDWARPTRRP